MTDLAEVGRNIALLRKARGLSRERAALEANMSVSCWQNIEMDEKTQRLKRCGELRKPWASLRWLSACCNIRTMKFYP